MLGAVFPILSLTEGPWHGRSSYPFGLGKLVSAMEDSHSGPSIPSQLPPGLGRGDIDWWWPAGPSPFPARPPSWASLAGKITHLGIGAHPDDLEFSFLHGIEACFDSAQEHFAGVTVTHGGGSLRVAGQSIADLIETRRKEQRAAAEVGRYGLLAQLSYSSGDLAGDSAAQLVDELTCLLEHTRPDVVYLHAPTDRHGSHRRVLRASLEALRRLPENARPRQVWGCEGWRDLDWLSEADRTALPVGRRAHLGRALGSLFDSQIASGKRYDLAVEGRRRAHACFSNPRAADSAEGLTLATDLSPLIRTPDLSLEEFVEGLLTRFAAECRTELEESRLKHSTAAPTDTLDRR